MPNVKLIATILPAAMFLAILTIAPTAHAHWITDLNRSLGIGWSDGYHSRTACPPRKAWWSAPGPCPTCGPAVFHDPHPATNVPVPASAQPQGDYYAEPTPASTSSYFRHWDKTPKRAR